MSQNKSETWSRKKKIDPATGKKISDLNRKEYRAYNQRQIMPRTVEMMENSHLQEIREEKKKPVTNPDTLKRSQAAENGKFITNALKAYLNGSDSFSTYPIRIQEFVKSIVKNAIKGNSSLVDITLNRTEGKVKDVVDVNMNMSDLRPDQAEIEEQDQQFKAIPETGCTDEAEKVANKIIEDKQVGEEITDN